MQAIIVAGGPGSRLRPLTDFRPKHVLPVGGVPFLAHQLARLAAAGVEQVALAVSYRAGDIVDVLGDGSAYGVQLRYVVEATPRGTGGAIRAGGAALDGAGSDPVVVLNGDVLSDHDIAAQVAHFEAAGAEVSLHVVGVGDARAYGSVPTDASGRVSAFEEKSARPVSSQINAGCYVFRRSVIAQIPANAVVSVERETFPGLLAAGRLLVGHRCDSYWLDVGTPQALVHASSDLVRGVVGSPALVGSPGQRWVHPDAVVHPTATVVGGSAVGPGATVGAGAHVDASVVMADATVGAGSVVRRCALGPGSRIGADVVADEVVLGDRAEVGSGYRPERGVRVACDARLPASAGHRP